MERDLLGLSIAGNLAETRAYGILAAIRAYWTDSSNLIEDARAAPPLTELTQHGRRVALIAGVGNIDLSLFMAWAA